MPAASKRFAVIGNPIAHSKSPFIHDCFGRQTGITLQYDRILAPVDAFESAVAGFFGEGGSGANVTVPFKEAAWRLTAGSRSARADMAGAVNTLWRENGTLHGCNTDGVGLVGDILRQGNAIRGRRILLVGAGGAAMGCVQPLVEAGCASLRIVNRNPERARLLERRIRDMLAPSGTEISSGPLDNIPGRWDIVVNATSSSLAGQAPNLPPDIYGDDALAYDMMYGALPTPFMRQAQVAGAARVSDGLGMLVGQAAASFRIWHGVQPDTAPVLEALRRELAGA